MIRITYLQILKISILKNIPMRRIKSSSVYAFVNNINIFKSGLSFIEKRSQIEISKTIFYLISKAVLLISKRLYFTLTTA